MAVLDFSSDVWIRALGLGASELPRVLVLEGTWWREKAVARRSARLDGWSESAFPDIFLARHRSVPVAYCCAYGAARAVEPAQIFAQLGTPLMVQIRSCGAIRSGIEPGSIMVPDRIAARDGLSPLYGAGAEVVPSPRWCDRAARAVMRRGLRALQGPHLTWPSLFAQSDAMCDSWREEGLLTVDMEASAVVAVAERWGSEAIALLAVWDALSDGRTFLDPLEPAASAALARASDATFEVALELAEEAALGLAA